MASQSQDDEQVHITDAKQNVETWIEKLQARDHEPERLPMKEQPELLPDVEDLIRKAATAKEKAHKFECDFVPSGYLSPLQQRGVEILWNMIFVLGLTGLVIALAPGMGKTRIGLVFCSYLLLQCQNGTYLECIKKMLHGQPPSRYGIIFVPNSLLKQYEREVGKNFKGIKIAFLEERLKQKEEELFKNLQDENHGKLVIYIIPQSAQENLFPGIYALCLNALFILHDESHTCKNRGANLNSILSRCNGVKIAMSGTPFYAHKEYNYKPHCLPKQIAERIPDTPTAFARIMGALSLRNEDVSTYMEEEIRLPGFCSVTFNVEKNPEDNSEQAKCQILQKAGNVKKSNKYPAIVSAAKKCVDQGHNVLILVDLVGGVEHIHQQLKSDGYESHILSSKQSPNERDALLRETSTKKGQIIVTTTALGSEGLNLQFCSVVITLSLDMYKMQQAVGRVWRRGQEKPVLHIVVADSRPVDDNVVEKNKDLVGALHHFQSIPEDVLLKHMTCPLPSKCEPCPLESIPDLVEMHLECMKLGVICPTKHSFVNPISTMGGNTQADVDKTIEVLREIVVPGG